MLSGVKSLALQSKATVDWKTFKANVEDYLDDVAPEIWRKIFRPLIQGVMTDQVKRWAVTLGLTFDVQPLFARSWFAKYMQGMPIPIIDTTKKAVWELIDEALKGGWSIPQMQDAIEGAFGIFEPYRSERIARTETIRASNAGSTEQFKEWGVKRHEWLSTKDDRTRRLPEDDYDHLTMDGQVKAIDEPFICPGKDGDVELMYPGDPSGPAGSTVNCRCTVLPIIEGMEGGGGEE